MTGIAEAVEQCLTIEGNIRIKPFSKAQKDKLNQITLWDYLKTKQRKITKFSDPTWHSEGNTLSISFIGVTPEFGYHLRALTLGMYTQGSGQGMDPLSWLSIRRTIENLKRFVIWLQEYKINSFEDLESLAELKLRNIIVSVIQKAN